VAVVALVLLLALSANCSGRSDARLRGEMTLRDSPVLMK
jgi:hypothetical protein